MIADLPTVSSGERDVVRRALVVGVNAVPTAGDMPPLHHAEQHAAAMTVALESDACGFSVSPFVAAQATADAVKRAIDEFTADAAEHVELIFYFSGYVLPVQVHDGATEAFIVTSDFRADLAARRPEFLLSLGWLYRNLYLERRAGSALIILDCCHSAETAAKDTATPADYLSRAIERYRQDSARDGRATLADRCRVLLVTAAPVAPAEEGDSSRRLTERLLHLLNGHAVESLKDGRLTPAVLLDTLRQQLGRPWFELSHIDRDCVIADHQRLMERARIAAQAGHESAYNERWLQSLIRDYRIRLSAMLEHFTGRADELVTVQSHIADLRPSGGYVIVTGPAGQGKSSLLARLVADQSQAPYHFVPINPGPDHQVSLLRNIMAQLIARYRLPDAYFVDSTSRSVLRDNLPRLLDLLAGRGVHETIYIDGLDQLEDESHGTRDLSFLPTRLPPGMVIVLSTRPDTIVHQLDLLEMQRVYPLPYLSRADFTRLLKSRGVKLRADLVARLYESMERNALYLDLAARELAQSAALIPERMIEWVSRNPNHVFSLTIDRLRRDRQLWRDVLKPILGVLLAAAAPLSARALRTILQLDAEVVQHGLQRLGGLVRIEQDTRYSLYHSKLRDFLRQPGEYARSATPEYVFAADEEEIYHQRIVDWAEGGRGGLNAIWFRTPDEALEERRTYAQQHYITHLVGARNYERLWEVLDEGSFGRAKLNHDPSTRSFSLDLDRARRAILDFGVQLPEERSTLLPKLWRYGLLRRRLTSRADVYPDSIYEAMLRLGLTAEALGMLELADSPPRRLRLLALAGAILSTTTGSTEMGRRLLSRVHDTLRGTTNPALLNKLITALTEGLREPLSASETTAPMLIPLVLAPFLDSLPVVSSGPLVPVVRTLAHWVTLYYLQVTPDRRAAGQALDRWLQIEPEAYPYVGRDTVLLDQQRALTLLDRRSEAQALADQLRGRARVRALCVLAEAQAQLVSAVQDMLAAAGSAADAIASGVERSGAWAEIGLAWRNSGDRAAAETAFATAVAIARQLGSLQQQSRAYVDLAETLTQAGYCDQAEVIAAEIATPWQRALILGRIGLGYVRLGHDQAADRVFSAAQTLAAQIPAALPQRSTQIRLLEVMVEAGRWREAATAAGRIKGVAEMIAPQLVAALIRAGAFSEAVRLIAAIPSIDERAAALGRMAAAQARSGMLREAHATLNQARTLLEQVAYRQAVDPLQVSVGRVIEMPLPMTHAVQCWKQIDAALMRGALEAARAVVDGLPPGWVRAAAIAEMIAGLVRFGHHEEVPRRRTQLHEQLARIDYDWERAAGLMYAAAMMVRANDYATAQTLFHRIANDQLRVEVFIHLANGLARADYPSALLDLVAALWLLAESREVLVGTFPTAHRLLPLTTEVRDELAEGGKWTTAFLR